VKGCPINDASGDKNIPAPSVPDSKTPLALTINVTALAGEPVNDKRASRIGVFMAL
jgi:hypothetical protein